MHDQDFLVFDKEKKLVQWFSANGIRIVRQFLLESSPTDAKFCTFNKKPLGNDTPIQDNASGSTFNYAVAILLSSGDLQIHMFSGELYEIRIGFPIKCMINASIGLLLQKDVDSVALDETFNFSLMEESIADQSDQNMHEQFYYLEDPLSVLKPVQMRYCPNLVLGILSYRFI